MSIAILKNSLTRDVKSKLLDLLLIQAKADLFLDGPKEILAFRVEGEHCYIPYYFARMFFGYGLNTLRPREVMAYTGSLRPYQQIVVDECMVQLREHGTTLLQAPPAAGKTMMGVYMACEFMQKTLIICPMTALPKQWKNTIDSYCIGKTYIIGEGLINEKDHQKMAESQFIVAYHERVMKIRLETRMKIGTVILDESHMLPRPSAMDALLSTVPRYVIACSATPSRKDGLYKVMHCITGTHFVENNHRPAFVVVKVNTGVSPATRQVFRGGRKQNDFQFLEKNSYLDPKRNEIVINICRKFASHENRFFVTVKRVDHGDLLYQVMKGLGMNVGRFMEKDVTFEDCHILIGMDKKMGTGFDEQAYCPGRKVIPRRFVIITQTINNKEGTTQMYGRGFRSDKPVIFDFVDNNYTMANHWKTTRLPCYKRDGARILDVTPGEINDIDFDKIFLEDMPQPVNHCGDTFEEQIRQSSECQ
jgi:hypothetical protein